MLMWFLFIQLSHAEMDAASQRGLKDTQDLMRSRVERDKFIRQNSKAQEVDRNVDDLTGGGADKEQVYDMAAKVMEKITEESGGDADKMQRLLQEAQQNPKAFYDRYFSAEDKARLKSMVKSIEAKKGGPSNRP